MVAAIEMWDIAGAAARTGDWSSMLESSEVTPSYSEKYPSLPLRSRSTGQEGATLQVPVCLAQSAWPRYAPFFCGQTQPPTDPGREEVRPGHRWWIPREEETLYFPCFRNLPHDQMCDPHIPAPSGVKLHASEDEEEASEIRNPPPPATAVPADISVTVRRQNMKVRINATEDTIVLKFVRPNPGIKLEGYILGYGSSMFSKQYIKLPDNGEPYETEIDAEPKYLVAVQPVPSNDVKKQCKERYFLEKPLHLVVGSVTPTSVLLSWGALVKTSYEGNILRDCLDDGNFTVRYREMNRRWNYQTCPTSDTVIDHLKPDTPYEFSVRPNQFARKVWSKTVVHNTCMDDKAKQKPIIPKATNTKPGKPAPHRPEPPPTNIHNSSQTKVFPVQKKPGPAATKSPPAPPKSHPEMPPVVKDRTPQSPLLPLGIETYFSIINAQLCSRAALLRPLHC